MPQSVAVGMRKKTGRVDAFQFTILRPFVDTQVCVHHFTPSAISTLSPYLAVSQPKSTHCRSQLLARIWRISPSRCIAWSYASPFAHSARRA
eukprot:2003635-Pleurochrysis_carterae.AAC.1